MTAVLPNGAHQTSHDSRGEISVFEAFFVVYLYIFLYGVFVYLSDQIALNYVVCIYFASPGASHLHD